MPSKSIMDRLGDGEFLLMDGATGSEIQVRGADVLIGASVEGGLAGWSATANVDNADVVQQVHQDYLRVGAEILISNNFWTTPSRLKGIGREDRWEEYARASARNAIKARDAMNPEAYVSGGIAAPSMQTSDGSSRSDVEIMGRDAYHKEFADHARLLAEEGVDFMLPEYVGHIDDCVEAVDACAEAGLPVMLGVRHLQTNGLMQYDETIEDLVKALDGHPVDGVLVMCSLPEALSAALPRLRDAYDGPVGAYPNIGYSPTSLLGGPTRDRWMNVTTYSPARVADFAAEWKEMGAQIVGACCGAGPEHILMMKQVLRG